MSPVASDAGYPAVWGGKVAARVGFEPTLHLCTDRVRYLTTRLPSNKFSFLQLDALALESSLQLP